FNIYGQNFLDSNSLATPVKKRKAKPIEYMTIIDELDWQLIEEQNDKMLQYISNALTSENVNRFAKEVLEGKSAVSASSIIEANPDTLVKVIGLYTYSQSPEREYNIRDKYNYVTISGIRFKEFIIEERKS
ncbi:MAG TPA: hypothetical protein IAD10_01280, partial [Candidatus Fimicola cottocaccae]|nr:hypothetical protein [Candidatus Fimicola cottocaccae]